MVRSGRTLRTLKALGGGMWDPCEMYSTVVEGGGKETIWGKGKQFFGLLV